MSSHVIISGRSPTQVIVPKPQAIAVVAYRGERGRDSGGGGGNNNQPFTQASLSIAGLLPVVHSVDEYPSAIAIYDEFGEIVEPDYWRRVSSTAIEVSLASFVPISGTWQFSITD